MSPDTSDRRLSLGPPHRRRARTPSLRTRVTGAATLVTTVIMVIIGAVVWTQISASAYRELDARVDTLSAAIQPSISNINASTVTTDLADGALTTTRLGSVKIGGTDTEIPQRPIGVGNATINGNKYRVKATSVLNAKIFNQTATVSVAVPLRSTLDRIDSQRNTLLLIGLGAIVATAILSWLLGGLAVRPLRRLATYTHSLPVDAGPQSPQRQALSTIRGAREAEELAAAMDNLLQRVDAEAHRTHEALVTARDFASISAHELRTPLTAMRTDLEVLDTFAPDAASRAQIVADLRRAHSRIQETLAALENLAQGDLGGKTREVADVVDIIDRVVTEADTRYPRTEIRMGGATQARAAVIDNGIRMAVENSVTNAVRHGRASRVIVGASTQHDDSVHIVIDDNGCGIPVSDRERLFTRFERGSSTESGSGLGLALIAQQAALHNGTASLHDSPLGGTRLVITIGPPTEATSVAHAQG